MFSFHICAQLKLSNYHTLEFFIVHDTKNLMPLFLRIQNITDELLSIYFDIPLPGSCKRVYIYKSINDRNCLLTRFKPLL